MTDTNVKFTKLISLRLAKRLITSRQIGCESRDLIVLEGPTHPATQSQKMEEYKANTLKLQIEGTLRHSGADMQKVLKFLQMGIFGMWNFRKKNL